jgi:hypothetical protein
MAVLSQTVLLMPLPTPAERRLMGQPCEGRTRDGAVAASPPRRVSRDLVPMVCPPVCGALQAMAATRVVS